MSIPAPPVAETVSARLTVIVPEPAASIVTALPAPDVMVLPAVDVRTMLPEAAALFWLRMIPGPAADRMSPSTVTSMPPDPAPPLAVTSRAVEPAPIAVSVPVVIVTLGATMFSVSAPVAVAWPTSVEPVPV